MTRQLHTFLAALVAVTAFAAARAEAQFDDAGYGESDYQTVGHRDREASFEARCHELEAELARYRGTYGDLAGDVGGCGSCDGGCDRCCLHPAGWFDCCCCGPTWAFSLGGDGWRDFGDRDLENNFGNRFALDATWDVNDSGLRAHLGAAYGLYNYHGRSGFLGLPNRTGSEQQIFLTAGAYRRGCDCGDWTWGASYDYLNDNHYGTLAESIELHQFRFLVGRMMNACNEFGVWGAFGVEDDEYGFPGGEVEVQDQVNLYWRRYWDFGGETMLYAGVAQTNFLMPAVIDQAWTVGDDDDLTEFVVGLRGIAPLTCNIGLYGGFHYVIPSASGGSSGGGGFGGGGLGGGGFGGGPLQQAALEENWSVGFGVMWVRGCSLPVLPTADNGWMGKRVRPGTPPPPPPPPPPPTPS